VEKTWMPTVAGILGIVSASFKLLAVFGLIIAIVVVEGNPYIDLSLAAGGVPVNVVAILWIITIPLAVFGILALVGGIYALRRKRWGLALAGSIGAFLPSSLLGMASVVLTALSIKEFEQS